MLRKIHSRRHRVDDSAHVADVLAAHSADNDHVRQLVERHAERCPSRRVDRGAHEHDVARFHKLPPPMFMATARIDAVWVHDGLLDARDYKTGGKWHERVADDPAAKVQAFVLDARRSANAGCGFASATSTCSPRSTTTPIPGSSTTTTLAAIEEELRGAVARMRTNEDWQGVADAAICSHVPRTDRSVATARRRASPRGRCSPALLETAVPETATG